MLSKYLESINSSFLLQAVIIFVIYLVLILVYIAPYQFNLSSLLKIDEHDANYTADLSTPGIVVFYGNGYDGQYNYYIVKDMFFKGIFKDAFRYQRILYPLLIKIVSIGSDKLIPISMILVNFISILIGMYFLRKLIANPSLNYLVILYGLNLGFVIGTLYDLGTPLAISLIVISLYYLKKEKIWLTGIFLAVSLLTMENAFLVIVPILLYFLCKKEWCKSGYILLSMLPWFIWQLILQKHFGYLPFLISSAVLTFPFQGIEQQIIYLMHQEYFGVKDILRQTSVLWMMLFVVTGLIISAYQFSKQKDLYTWIILIHAIFGICLSQSMIWSHTITSPTRVLSGMFPLIILGFVQDKENKLLRYLIYFCWFLTGLGIIRVFLLPQYPYHIS